MKPTTGAGGGGVEGVGDLTSLIKAICKHHGPIILSMTILKADAEGFT